MSKVNLGNKRFNDDNYRRLYMGKIYPDNRFVDGDLVKIKNSSAVYSFDKYVGGGMCILSDISGRTFDTYLHKVELHERRGIIE